MFSGPESSRSTPAVACSGFSSQQWCTVPRGLCPNSEVQARCCCRSTGNAQRAQKDMCEGQCARSEMEAGPSFGRWSHLVIPFRKGAGSHQLAFPLSFPFPGGFSRASLVWGWDAVLQTSSLIAFMVGLYLFVFGPALSSILLRASPSELLPHRRLRTFIPSQLFWQLF